MSNIFKATARFNSEIINFEEFFRRIPRNEKPFNDRVYGYNSLIGYGEDDTSNYIRRSVIMVRGSEKKLALANIFVLANHTFKWKMPIQEFYEELVFGHLEQFGDPRCLVKLGSRRYAALNPEDFLHVWGKQGYTLACFATNRLRVCEMMPVTEEQMWNKARELNPEIKPYKERNS